VKWSFHEMTGISSHHAYALHCVISD